jgi:hypothetical protein
MFCRKCGTPNQDDAPRCASCGDLLQSLTPRKIDNHLVLAILVTALCCLPFGIVGIVYAAQVNGRALSGDLAGAEESARRARTWSLWGLGLGLTVYVIYVLFALIGVMSGAAAQ